MKRLTMLAPLVALFFFSACEPRRQADTTGEATREEVGPATQAPARGIVLEQNGIRLTSIDDSPLFPEARLRKAEPQNNSNIASGPVTFRYEITNFQLTEHTHDVEQKDLAYSQQGQHIHNIVNNEPYTAHYETEFTKDLPQGNHVVLSFLSRSYHEGLKHAGAHDLVLFSVGNPGQSHDFDRNGQHMFFSRPKGDYSGPNETQRVMLDFYLVNTTLAPDGNRVRATINGTEFMLEHWVPYAMEGLPMGQNTIRLELVDQDGNVIPGPYNTVERTITLKPGA
jgi:hypothetical protein